MIDPSHILEGDPCSYALASAGSFLALTSVKITWGFQSPSRPNIEGDTLRHGSICRRTSTGRTTTRFSFFQKQTSLA
jgi:hypothetical protein